MDLKIILFLVICLHCFLVINAKTNNYFDKNVLVSVLLSNFVDSRKELRAAGIAEY